MEKRILVPLDGSETAEAILPHINQTLAKPGTEILLLRVVEQLFSDTVPTLGPFLTDADEYLRGVYVRITAPDVRVRARVEHGSPVKTILRVAEEEQVSLIAMASHGRSGLDRVLMGSVAEGVVRSSKVPTFLLRAIGGEVQVRPIRRILVPIGGGEFSLKIVPHVSDLARALGAEILVLHVAEQDMESVAMTRGAEEAIRASGILVRTKFDEGEPTVVILDTVRMAEVDLVAMATHARNVVSQVFFGSVTQRVLREGGIPMLVTRGALEEDYSAAPPKSPEAAQVL